MATLGPMQPMTVFLSELSSTAYEANASYDDNQVGWSGKVHVIGTSFLLGVIILSTIVGNVFVIAAIVLERNLRNVANYLISSLAVADLMVAALVMPLAAVYEVSSEWFLGPEVCDMWISFDVLCCTSSILHLVAISIDRYWAVTQADYIHNRSSARILVMVALSWGVSALISIPPLFGSRDPKHNPDSTGLCLISQDWTYTVFSTIGAFYLPLIVMMIIYLKIFNAARSRIRKRHFRRGGGFATSGSQSPSTSVPNKVIFLDETQLLSGGKPCPAAAVVASAHASCCIATGDGAQSGVVCETSSSVCILPRSEDRSPPHHSTLHHHLHHHHHHHHHPTSSSSYRWEKMRQQLRKGINGSWISRSQDEQTVDTTTTTDDDASFAERKRKAKEKLEAKRERKAARTLAIVTGTFVVCWLPFFIVALVRPFCGDACPYPRILVSIIGWLGYFNSLLNPVIYTIFNPDFRLAFRKILFGKYRRSAQNRRISMRLLRR